MVYPATIKTTSPLPRWLAASVLTYGVLWYYGRAAHYFQEEKKTSEQLAIILHRRTANCMEKWKRFGVIVTDC